TSGMVSETMMLPAPSTSGGTSTPPLTWRRQTSTGDEGRGVRARPVRRGSGRSLGAAPRGAPTTTGRGLDGSVGSASASDPSGSTIERATRAPRRSFHRGGMASHLGITAAGRTLYHRLAMPIEIAALPFERLAEFIFPVSNAFGIMVTPE